MDQGDVDIFLPIINAPDVVLLSQGTLGQRTFVEVYEGVDEFRFGESPSRHNNCAELLAV